MGTTTHGGSNSPGALGPLFVPKVLLYMSRLFASTGIRFIIENGNNGLDGQPLGFMATIIIYKLCYSAFAFPSSQGIIPRQLKPSRCQSLRGHLLLQSHVEVFCSPPSNIKSLICFPSSKVGNSKETANSSRRRRAGTVTGTEKRPHRSHPSFFPCTTRLARKGFSHKTGPGN